MQHANLHVGSHVRGTDQSFMEHLYHMPVHCESAKSCGLEHSGWVHEMQVETAVVQPLKDALTEEQWTQHKARLTAESEAHKQAEEAAERERQLAEAEAAQQQAAEEAQEQRRSTLTKVGSSALLLAAC